MPLGENLAIFFFFLSPLTFHTPHTKLGIQCHDT